jgi:hypothetical protein
MRLLLAVVCVTVLAAAAGAAEAPQPMTAEQAAAQVAKAPPCPALAAMELKTTAIDYIDCTDPKDPHGFMDQGTSKVVTGPAGTYRVTAPHAHAFFGYRFKSAGKDKPVLVVFEYPDDADRNISFFTSESGLTGSVNGDWGLETGVYTGTPLPLSNKMQYHTFIYWPQDEWPALLVANFNRAGGAGAASRIWVYSIDAPLPKLQVSDPDAANPRRLGHYNSRGYYLAQRLYFGLKSPKAIEHMLEYFDYIGVNELSWGVGHSDDATIPAFGIKGTHLDEVLAAMDAKGGFRFTACIYIGEGISLGKLSTDELKATLIKGYDEFLDRYGKYKSLKGLTLGAMYGIEPVADMIEKGIAKEVVDHIKAKRPDLEVATYLGGQALHAEYFAPPAKGGTAPSAEKVAIGWETSGQSWSDWLGNQALECWKAWGRSPEAVRSTGLRLYEQLQPDDFRVFEFYGTAQDPRSMMYYDLDRSQKRSDLIGSPYAAIWNTHYEGHLGIVKDYNFWYTKAWVAPDFNAPPPRALAHFANALGLRDRLLLIPGSWNVRYFGHEADTRRFAQAYRALPPVELKDAASPVDSVKVRWAVDKGKRYVSVVSRIPFASEVTVDGKKVSLPPYELVTMVDEGKAEPKVAGQPCAEYKAWLTSRLDGFDNLVADLRKLDASAAPEVWSKAAAEARKQLEAGQLYAADLTVGPGMINELALRKDVLARPTLTAAKVAAAPPMNGDLSAWPKDAADLKADTGAELACHMYFPNSWRGPEDLSARVRLANDGTKLYVGVEVVDQKVVSEEVALYRGGNQGKKVTHADGFTFKLSPKAYRDWRAPNDGSCKAEINWPVELPYSGAETKGQGRSGFAYTCRKTAKGYVVEGSAPLADLGLKAGDSIGFVIMVNDYDESVPPNLKDAGWAAKQVMLIPHKPNFVYYEDARTCGTLLIGK